jgi:serine/threonine protein kinase
VIDFGIAANLLASTRNSISLIAGTAAYMAPERFSGSGDHRVDVYALGCMLFQLLTGSLPFAADDFPHLMSAHLTAPPPRATLERPDLPEALDGIVIKAMAKNPDDRYGSAGGFADALRKVAAGAVESSQLDRAREPSDELAGELVTANDLGSRDPALGHVEEVGKRRQRRRIAGVLALVVVVIASVLTLSIFGRGSSHPNQTGAAPAPPPATASTSSQQPNAEPVQASKIPVRIYNNSTVFGLAEKAESDLRLRGWNVVETGNYAQGAVSTSTVYYRPGTAEEVAALQLASEVSLKVEPRFPGIEGAAPGLIVIVTYGYP